MTLFSPLPSTFDPTLLRALQQEQETLWLTPDGDGDGDAAPFARQDIAQASARLHRFASFVALAFPETEPTGGIIESALTPAPQIQGVLGDHPGRLLLKQDNALPVAGSIKARGGVYEVFCVAERIAIKAGLLSTDGDTAILASPQARALFARHSLAVGSTGNLGLSIGITGAALGFRVTVHMSADAKAWKKALLRRHGVTVIEYATDYNSAVAQGRAEAAQDPLCHFVDDERSADLFLGYAVAAERLRDQLAAAHIAVDQDHPLFVSLPCGVGGAPGGVAFGLKALFGSAVHCFFAEPTAAPCMMLGIASGLHDAIAVQDIGLSGLTCADGLAVSRPSALVGRLMSSRIGGVYTVRDETMLRLSALLYDHEGLFVEPSAAAALPGMGWICGPDALAYRTRHGLGDTQMQQATHIAWLTGGSMVPDDERAALRSLANGCPSA